MQYHISSGLIVKHFEEDCFCPICTIEKIVEQNICREMLADACMDDDVRTRVNALGFCEKHFNILLSMPSKLGLALQCGTRISALETSTLAKPNNSFKAKKQAKRLLNQTKTCLICDLVQDEMIKYYKTIAQMYACEPEWHNKIEKTEGFCLTHYAKLLEYSTYAATKSKSYINVLYKVQQKRVEKTQELLARLCARHDYRNLGTPLGEAQNALPLTAELFYGKNSDKNKK